MGKKNNWLEIFCGRTFPVSEGQTHVHIQSRSAADLTDSVDLLQLRPIRPAPVGSEQKKKTSLSQITTLI